MKTQILAKNVVLTPEVETYILNRSQKISRLKHSVIKAVIEIIRLKRHNHAEDLFDVKMIVEKDGKKYVAKHRAAQVTQAVDKIVQNVFSQLVSQRKRYIHSVRSGARKIKMLIRKSKG